jgi:Rrf2 family protein
MRLQKATRYGLYAVLELARDPERQLSATDIAERYGISANHLAKVLRELGRAGLVEAARGAGGGYRFAGNARRTTLLDVVKLFENIEGDSGLHEAGDETDIGGALNLVLGEIDDIARATLGSVTLSTLLKTMQWQGERKERLKERERARSVS